MLELVFAITKNCYSFMMISSDKRYDQLVVILRINLSVVKLKEVALLTLRRLYNYFSRNVCSCSYLQLDSFSCPVNSC